MFVKVNGCLKIEDSVETQFPRESGHLFSRDAEMRMGGARFEGANLLPPRPQGLGPYRAVSGQLTGMNGGIF